jgi:hypothetical protein
MWTAEAGQRYAWMRWKGELVQNGSQADLGRRRGTLPANLFHASARSLPLTSGSGARRPVYEPTDEIVEGLALSGFQGGKSRNQGGDESAEKSFASAAHIMDDLEETEIGRKLLLGDAPVGAQPRAQQ